MLSLTGIVTLVLAHSEVFFKSYCVSDAFVKGGFTIRAAIGWGGDRKAYPHFQTVGGSGRTT